MTIRTRLILELAAVLVPAVTYPSFAQIQPSSAVSITPLAASAPTAVPALVPYSGVVIARDAHALSSETGITFLIYKDQNGGEPLFIETQNVLPDATGHYTARLGASKSSGIPIDLFSTGEARWLEVQVAGEPTQPRTLLASVPYALKAADAATLGGLPASAFMLSPSASIGSSRSLAITPNATTTVTTTGGTSGTLPYFNGSSSILSTKLYSTGSSLGIGKVPAATLDVAGTAFMGGQVVVEKIGTATASSGSNSHSFLFQASAYNSSSKAAVTPFIQFEAEAAGNNTSTPSATLNLLSGTGSATPAETGLYINSNGTIHFATGQTFPGGTGGTTGSPVCVATAGGFGGGGTTFVGPSFAIPSGGGCSAWSGFTKTASTVVLTTSGAGCLSTDGKKLTLSVSSADPNYLGAGTQAPDYIQLTRTSTTGTFTTGSDQGEFGGSAKQITCTSSLLQLNENND